MENTDAFFSEFPGVDKQTWLRQIAKELRDRSLDDARWALSEGLTVDPFVHPDDQPAPPPPLWEAGRPWSICEWVDAGRDDAHAVIMEALEGGAESIELHLSDPGAELPALLDGVSLGFIGLHLSGPAVLNAPLQVLDNLLQAAGGVPLSGSVALDPEALDKGMLTEIATAAGSVPGFLLFGIKVPETGHGPDAAAATLKALLEKSNRAMGALSEAGLPVQLLHVELPVGPSYFVEMAKLRAFRLLWFNLLKHWGQPASHPVIHARFSPGAYTDEIYTNMIRATTMAMSAVLGGADRLTVRPYDEGRESLAPYDKAFGRRIARNVQHLLKMESSLEGMADPASGSYYIEKLTLQLAGAALTK